jgi:hypothetical protein
MREGTRHSGWLKRYVTILKVVGSIPEEGTAFLKFT